MKGDMTMTVKEYLSHACRLDAHINSKLDQLMSLRELANKATSTLTAVPPSGTRNVHKMENVIIDIVSLENEINADIDALVDVKRKIGEIIKTVENPKYQLLLELRYLCFKKWEEIAVIMDYSVDNIYKMHRKALEDVEIPKSLQ